MLVQKQYLIEVKRLLQSEPELVTPVLAEIASQTRRVFPDANGRVERAEAMVWDTAEWIALDAGSLLIHSQSNGNVWHKAGELACTCPDHQNRGVTCKHMLAAGFLTRLAQRDWEGERRKRAAGRLWAGSESPQHEGRNLLTLALAEEKAQWYHGEVVWLIPGKVFIKNEDCFVKLNLVGFQPAVCVFWLDLAAGEWVVAKDGERAYRAWAEKAKAWYQEQKAKGG